MCFGEALRDSELRGPSCELRDGKPRVAGKPFERTVCGGALYYRTRLFYEYIYILCFVVVILSVLMYSISF